MEKRKLGNKESVSILIMIKTLTQFTVGPKESRFACAKPIKMATSSIVLAFAILTTVWAVKAKWTCYENIRKVKLAKIKSRSRVRGQCK